ncbi:MAG: hypothetical protein SO161_06475 [Treponema sp.]|nr:hypothetical protein [Treponema sp.]
MSLQNEFKTFVSNISTLDFEDIDTKYKGITKKLNSHYYESDSETDNSKNVGPQAEKRDQIRGQIEESKYETKTEPISFDGPHFVECYIIKDGVCVARDCVDVPIKLDSIY